MPSATQLSTAAELQQRLRITVHDTTGRELAQVAIGAAVPQAVDPLAEAYDADAAEAASAAMLAEIAAAAKALPAHEDVLPRARRVAA